jgi:hypothetical protein
MTVALLAGSVALCGTAGASAPTVSTAASGRVGPAARSEAAARSKPTPKPAVLKVYLKSAGSGNKALSSVNLPAGWTVVWRFDCQNLAKQRGTFVLSSTAQGASPVKLTDQTGLGGGGQKPFTRPGRYGFAINTSCGWDLTVESTPPPAAK